MSKEIKLTRLVLSNWKSLNLDVTFNDGKTIVKGRNGVGKSSLASAWNWLLTGYCNAFTPKNHELFDNRIELSHETPIASVKAWISVNDIEYTIEKTAQAKFTRKRGTSEYVKESSDTYKILIDEIEISATDFLGWLEHNICPVDMLVYCLDGGFFSTLADDDKKKSRKVLETIVGEITQDDYKGDYSCLANDFAKGYTIEQIEEKTKNQIKPIKDRQTKIPALIEDKEKMLAEYSQLDYDDIERQIAEKKNAIEDIDNAILGKSESIKPILDKRDAMFEIINSNTISLNDRKNDYIDTYNAVINEIKRKIDDIESSNASIVARNKEKELKYQRQTQELVDLKKEHQSLCDYREVLRKRKDDIKATVFNGDTCVVCGQELPYEMLENAKAKFNKRKNEDLDYIIAQGKQTTEKISTLLKQIEALQTIVDSGVSLEVWQSTALLQAELDEYESKYIPFEETEEYAKLVKEIDVLKASLPEIPKIDTQSLTNTKKTLIDALGTLYQLYGRKSKAGELKSEIDALKYELRHTGNELAKLEMILDKCKEYAEERANIISDRINDKLVNSRIQMWQKQKNGELSPSCTITDKQGVKYSTLNNSNRIKTCIELQQMFCKHYDVALPIFIDEYSVFDSFNVPAIDTQHICLIASDSPTLVIE
jgi:hypothetical protein